MHTDQQKPACPNLLTSSSIEERSGVKLLFYSHCFAPSIGRAETIAFSLARGLAEARTPGGLPEFNLTLLTESLYRRLCYLLVPSLRKRRLRARSGPRSGLIFEISPRWERQQLEGNHELASQQVLAEWLRSGGLFCYVGAGFGSYSSLAARSGPLVFASEPDEKNCQIVATARRVGCSSFQNQNREIGGLGHERGNAF